MTKKTTEVAQRAAQEGLTPLEYMLRVMRNPRRSPAERMEAAKAAAPYMHPRLSTIELNLSDLSDEDLLDAAR